MSYSTLENPSTLRALDAINSEQDRLTAIHNASQDLSAGRGVADAIKAIPQHALTPEIVAHWLAVINGSVSRSTWSSLPVGEIVQGVLADLADDINFREE